MATPYPVADSLPHRQRAIYLLRALLRQCRYLPDPQARTFCTQQILSRYRKYHPSLSGSPPSHSRQPDKSRHRKLFGDARKALSTLIRANEGELKPLHKVLMHTYGRVGKRRFQLLEAVRQPNKPQNTDALYALAEQPRLGPAEHGWTPGLRALVKSQVAANLPGDLRMTLKMLDPKIPEKNIWGRPTPKKRKKNLIKKHMWEQILMRVHAPLSEDEWMRLKDLATGKMEWEGPVVRGVRPGATGRSKGEAFARDCILEESTEYGMRHHHTITPRFMRRLWAQVFAICPVMRWDYLKKEWAVEWGSAVNQDARAQTAARDVDPDMFKGVDHKGQIPRDPKSLPPKRFSLDDRQDIHSNLDIRYPTEISSDP